MMLQAYPLVPIGPAAANTIAVANIEFDNNYSYSTYVQKVSFHTKNYFI
jgi:hypothetical protein